MLTAVPGIQYKIKCDGADAQGDPCVEINYEGETSRSTNERFVGHMNTLLSKNEQTRQTSFLYNHMWEAHNGEIPPLKIEILGKYPGDPGLRQAMEAVSIRRNKPKLNGKNEWTNEPRPRTKKNTQKM